MIKEQNEGKGKFNNRAPQKIDMFNAKGFMKCFNTGIYSLKKKEKKTPQKDLINPKANAEINGEKLSDEFLGWVMAFFKNFCGMTPQEIL
ncbi:MAG: hypothetical protein CM15mP126_1680 [Gammaproteobacteria bacterium]|nr:MAG: hypothetical protein CM15mP126_1680 [Gammaproteobacteria bacterium]